jgi:hypothetical protein
MLQLYTDHVISYLRLCSSHSRKRRRMLLQPQVPNSHRQNVSQRQQIFFMLLTLWLTPLKQPRLRSTCTSVSVLRFWCVHIPLACWISLKQLFRGTFLFPILALLTSGSLWMLSWQRPGKFMTPPGNFQSMSFASIDSKFLINWIIGSSLGSLNWIKSNLELLNCSNQMRPTFDINVPAVPYYTVCLFPSDLAAFLSEI